MPPVRRTALVAPLLLALATSASAAQEPMSQNPSARIARIRAESNAALAAGDVAAFMDSIDLDYVGTGGDGGHIRSRDALEELIRGVAASPTGVYFVRTLQDVRISADGLRAMESGRWEGREGRPAGTRVTRGGRYTAYWREVDGRWVIHAEVFVTLSGG